jgi:endonuclease/exonuclease/phosphatase family metal-dependent hydrolase
LKRLRVCTLNVHAWRDENDVDRVDEVVLFLSGIQCDLVMLNEVPSPDGALAHVAKALKMHVAYAPASFAGNALLSRTPLSHARSVPLNATRSAEVRSAVIAQTIIHGEEYLVACVHLDHRREVARLEQVARLHAELAKHHAHIVVGGDFNALRMSDYPPDVLAQIAAHRDATHWEAPAGNVVARMDAWGYVDALRLSQNTSGPLPPHLARTCWAGTRIDYIWLSTSLASGATQVDGAVADIDVSDHKPVVVTLHFKTLSKT